MAEESHGRWSLWLGGASLITGLASFVAAVAQRRLVDAELSTIRLRGQLLDQKVDDLEAFTKSEVDRLEADMSILRNKLTLELFDE